MAGAARRGGGWGEAGGESIRNRRLYSNYPEERIPVAETEDEVFELIATFNYKARRSGDRIDIEAYIEPQPKTFKPASEYTAEKIAGRMGRLYKVLDA